MNYKINKEKCLIVLNKGDDIITSIKKVCKDNRIKTGCITGIGASQSAVIGIFDNNLKKYNEKNINTFCEITSLLGNVTIDEDENPYLHMHITLADKDSIYSGHLIKCTVGLTMEIFMDIFPIEAQRKFDEELRVNLINI